MPLSIRNRTATLLDRKKKEEPHARTRTRTHTHTGAHARATRTPEPRRNAHQMKTGGAKESYHAQLCPEWGSNPQPFRERILSPPRLPISPSGRKGQRGLRLPSPDPYTISSLLTALLRHLALCAEGECACHSSFSCGRSLIVGREEQFCLSFTVSVNTPVVLAHGFPFCLLVGGRLAPPALSVRTVSRCCGSASVPGGCLPLE